MTDPGRFKSRLVLERPVETPDGAGGAVRSYETQTALWAEVAALSSRESFEAAAAGASVTHRISVRAGPDITTRHRLRDGARVFRIVALRERPGRFLEIEAEERRD